VTVHPGDLLERFARSLSGVPVAELRARLATFFAVEDAELLGFGPSDLAQVLGRALARLDEERDFGLLPGRANSLMVHACESESARDIAAASAIWSVTFRARTINAPFRIPGKPRELFT